MDLRQPLHVRQRAALLRSLLQSAARDDRHLPPGWSGDRRLGPRDVRVESGTRRAPSLRAVPEPRGPRPPGHAGCASHRGAPGGPLRALPVPAAALGGPTRHHGAPARARAAHQVYGDPGRAGRRGALPRRIQEARVHAGRPPRWPPGRGSPGPEPRIRDERDIHAPGPVCSPESGRSACGALAARGSARSTASGLRARPRCREAHRGARGVRKLPPGRLDAGRLVDLRPDRSPGEGAASHPAPGGRGPGLDPGLAGPPCLTPAGSLLLAPSRGAAGLVRSLQQPAHRRAAPAADLSVRDAGRLARLLAARTRTDPSFGPCW